jgi:hypothetical protein
MNRDKIAEIGFDEQGRLYVMPLTVTFPYVYREAMEVAWDDEYHYLCAPPPPRSQLAPVGWWLRQIFAAARAQDCELHLAPETKLRNIPHQLVDEIKTVLREHND